MQMSRSWETLPPFSQAVYKETYFLPGEDYEGWLDRVSTSYQNDPEHGLRMKSYIKNLWVHPSTPPSTSAGTDRGLPISCFTKTVFDDKPSIFQNYQEAMNLGAYGGGIGTDWSSVREVNHPVGQHGGASSGVIPFLGISDRSTLAISQGGSRRASEAVYMHISHPEIEEFIDLRKETGDANRRCPNLHHGVVISDDFMYCVINDADYGLFSPKTGERIKSIKARKIWTQILEARITTGEPYIMFEDTVNDLAPAEYKQENIHVTTSNLCTEITLRTDAQHSGVCCLGSINLEYWDEYQHCFDQFIADCTDYLDNILQSFIDLTTDLPGFERARAGAVDERSIGLGVMGFHSLLQSKLIPWESPMAKGLNLKIFQQIKDSANYHNSYCDGESPMADRHDSRKRNIHVTAIAPTMSISSLCGVASSGIEPWVSNAFTKKVKQGSFAIKNKYLRKITREFSTRLYPSTSGYGETDRVFWEEEQWDSIKKNNGSVQHLDWMPQDIKDVFKTAFELDQRYLLELAGDRSPLIDQGQSLNLFIPAGSSVQYISDLHILAWKKKIKSLYYVRSSAGVSASTTSGERKQINTKEVDMMSDSCLSCT
jgi:ribonucleoside-diphosphate reductase alpha chain